MSGHPAGRVAGVLVALGAALLIAPDGHCTPAALAEAGERLRLLSFSSDGSAVLLLSRSWVGPFGDPIAHSEAYLVWDGRSRRAWRATYSDLRGTTARQHIPADLCRRRIGRLGELLAQLRFAVRPSPSGCDDPAGLAGDDRQATLPGAERLPAPGVTTSPSDAGHALGDLRFVAEATHVSVWRRRRQLASFAATRFRGAALSAGGHILLLWSGDPPAPKLSLYWSEPGRLEEMTPVPVDYARAEELVR